MARKILIFVAGLVACSGNKPTLPPIVLKQPPDAVVAPPDAFDQEESLAAIQKAMNELDEAVQGCWAVVATERFDIEGDLTAQIAIEEHAAHATLVVDTTHNAKLAACVTTVLEAYPWAPPLHGQTIQLPFRIRHPSDGQNVIDRALVSAVGQGDARLSVLLDTNNTGAEEASMIEVQLATGAATGNRYASKDEIWFFKSAGTIGGAGKPVDVTAGDFMTCAKNCVRDVRAPKDGPLDAVVVMTPGGPEGAARAGALPTREAKGWEKTPLAPKVYHGGTSYPRGVGKVTIVVEKFAPASGSILEFPAGMVVPEHVHAKEAELLYVLSGSGTLTVKGQALPIIATSVVQIPPNTPHAFATNSDLRAVQFYTPAGPEQRFKKP